MAWQGTLKLQYQRRGDHTVAHDRHDGPLRVLRALYPEGPGVCHHVLVHPPGGLVSGDDLSIQLDIGQDAHALITTPGATRFYRSSGSVASQCVQATLRRNARLEWLPLETIVHDHASGRNQVRFALEPGAQMMGWDMLALGLPASGESFAEGRFEQQIEWPDTWLERGVLDLTDPARCATTQRLLASPLGWHGRSLMATMWLANGSPWPASTVNQLLESTRAAFAAVQQASSALRADRDSTARTSSSTPVDSGVLCGVSSPHDRLLVLRVLAHRTEMAWPTLRAVRDTWRREAWQLTECAPRVWST